MTWDVCPQCTLVCVKWCFVTVALYYAMSNGECPSLQGGVGCVIEFEGGGADPDLNLSIYRAVMFKRIA